MSQATSDIGPFTIVPAWIIRAGVSDRALRLFIALGMYANQQHEAFPSRRTLANDLRSSPDSVDRAVKELAAIGALDVESRRDSAGDRTTNLYRLKFSEPPQVAEVAAPLRPPSRTAAATGSRTPAARVAAPVRHRTRSTGTKKEHTHTAGARETVSAAQNQEPRPTGQPIVATIAPAPRPALTASGAGVGTLPRDHVRHAWCGNFRKCVPDFLHGEFVRAMGGAPDAAATRLKAFYEATMADIPDDQVLADEPPKFWRAAFARAFGSQQPRQDSAAAAAHRRAIGPAYVEWECPHVEHCGNRGKCKNLLGIDPDGKRYPLKPVLAAAAS